MVLFELLTSCKIKKKNVLKAFQFYLFVLLLMICLEIFFLISFTKYNSDKNYTFKVLKVYLQMNWNYITLLDGYVYYSKHGLYRWFWWTSSQNRTRDQNHMHCPISNQIVKTEFWLYIVNFYKKHSFVSDIKNVCDYY